MVYQDKLWIKFKDLDIECFCAYNERRCPLETKECRLYLAKFICIDGAEREERVKSVKDSLEAKIKQQQRKFESELKRSIKKFKI